MLLIQLQLIFTHFHTTYAFRSFNKYRCCFLDYIHTASLQIRFIALIRFFFLLIAVHVVVLNVANIRFQCEQIMVLN